MKKIIIGLLIAVCLVGVFLIDTNPEHQEARKYKEVERILEADYVDGDVVEIWDVEDNEKGTYRVDYVYIRNSDGHKMLRTDYYVHYEL